TAQAFLLNYLCPDFPSTASISTYRADCCSFKPWRTRASKNSAHNPGKAAGAISRSSLADAPSSKPERSSLSKNSRSIDSRSSASSATASLSRSQMSSRVVARVSPFSASTTSFTATDAPAPSPSASLQATRSTSSSLHSSRVQNASTSSSDILRKAIASLGSTTLIAFACFPAASSDATVCSNFAYVLISKQQTLHPSLSRPKKHVNPVISDKLHRLDINPISLERTQHHFETVGPFLDKPIVTTSIVRKVVFRFSCSNPSASYYFRKKRNRCIGLGNAHFECNSLSTLANYRNRGQSGLQSGLSQTECTLTRVFDNYP